MVDSRKTVSVLVAADGVPIVEEPRSLDKTREIAVVATPGADEEEQASDVQGAPRKVVDDEATVPVHSSIESLLTFEVLRRQSTPDEDDDEDDDEEEEELLTGSRPTLPVLARSKRPLVLSTTVRPVRCAPS